MTLLDKMQQYVYNYKMFAKPKKKKKVLGYTKFFETYYKIITQIILFFF